MRIVVAGANGLVGSRLVRVLEQQEHEVLALGRGPRRAESRGGYMSADLEDAVQVDHAVLGTSAEVVINTASMTEVDACEKDREGAFAANVLAPANLARASSKIGAHFLHVSTDYVFDGDKGPYAEEDIPNPRGVYAVTKHMGEEATRTLAGNWAIARTAVVYGWPMAARPNFGAWLVGSLSEGKPTKLFDDQYVSPSFADNVAEMLAELGTRKLHGVWNVCGRDVVNRVQFAEALCDVFGFDRKLIVPTKLADLKLPSPRPLRSGLKTAKVEAVLKAKPLGLPEALKAFHDAYTRATH